MTTHATGREPATAETITSTPGTGTTTEALTQRLIAALRGLPTWGHHEVLRERLMAMLARHEQTGDLSEFEHFTESLVMTARMERSPAFLATAASEQTPAAPRDLLDVIQQIEASGDDGRT
ncbi:MAG TPA: hypothetical protein VGG05_20560 [Pseudonocardiaceae bacterium]